MVVRSGLAVLGFATALTAGAPVRAAGPASAGSPVTPAPSPSPSEAATKKQNRPAPAKRPSVAPARYAQAVKAWHTPSTGKKPLEDERGRPMLSLYALNTGERLDVSATGEGGSFTARDLDRAAHLFREPSSGSEHPVEPRLLDLLYRIQRKFGAHEIRLVSGFRPGKSAPLKGPVHASGSNHSCGRAADIVVPGARDEDVAKFARDLGFVGVGIYPTSGFVHVDVRGRSYFWVDKSAPGHRNRERGVLSDLAKKSDSRAASRGEKPTPPFAIAIEVGAMDGARDRDRSESSDTSDDDDDE